GGGGGAEGRRTCHAGRGAPVPPPACDFGLVLPSTNVGPFLKWDATAPAPPAGFIGDGQTPHKITGSPFGNNLARLDGPNAGGRNRNTIQTDLFTVIRRASPAAGPPPPPGRKTALSL